MRIISNNIKKKHLDNQMVKLRGVKNKTFISQKWYNSHIEHILPFFKINKKHILPRSNPHLYLMPN